MHQPRILIMHATGGMGHVKAAAALAEAFAQRYPDAHVENHDALRFAPSWFRFGLVDGYDWVSANVPWVWKRLYTRFNNPKRHDFLTTLSRRALGPKIFPFLRDYRPDFFIATHPLPLKLAALAHHDGLISCPTSITITDYGCHSFWVHPEVNYYFSATDGVAACLRGWGVPNEKIVVSGIPIAAKFSQVLDPTALRRRLGLSVTAPTLLVVGGQLAFSRLRSLVTRLLKTTSAQVLVVAGRDVKLYRRLGHTHFAIPARVKTFGFVSNIEELMTVSDLVFTKAGGLTVSECLGVGVPMVIGHVIPGQEEDNVSYLVGKGAAVHVNDLSRLEETILRLMAAPQKLARLREACRTIRKPQAAAQVAEFVMTQVQSRAL